MRPGPTLDEVVALAEAGRFDEAQALAAEHVRRVPDGNDAHILIAQMALNRPEPPTPPEGRPDPKPALLALEHLDRVRPGDRVLAAVVALNRGKAQYRLARMDDAEESWDEALRLDPRVPEAGWCLLELYYLQNRPGDARRLALRLHEVEPDPRDRVQLLLELVRQDAQPMDPGSVVQWFEPVVRQNPTDLHASLALGLVLVRARQVDRGLDVLRGAVRRHPKSPDAWDAWLTGLDDAGQLELMERGVTRLPPALADSDRFARHAARVAQERADWKAAARDYRALAGHTHDHRLQYRFSRPPQCRETAEAERHEQDYQAYVAASREIRPSTIGPMRTRRSASPPHPPAPGNRRSPRAYGTARRGTPGIASSCASPPMRRAGPRSLGSKSPNEPGHGSGPSEQRE
ncbi:MAG: tetratricopeptide repeat protein [Singulisphaera sp.]